MSVVIGVLAAAVVAVWCLLGIALYAAKEHRIRRAETKAIADLKTAAAWETFDARRGIRIAENYANNPDTRATWARKAAPKGGGNA